ncbi:hypothetical protein [Bradyrhizobium algeriense]|uniref:hypothetical protein n=1 Tax=Bradyrhizobium algeriense TaxID=634784 RepID=UPI0011AE324F|nr:hypothetical protein [Bradyrhizobium algeriense]
MIRTTMPLSQSLAQELNELYSIDPNQHPRRRTECRQVSQRTKNIRVGRDTCLSSTISSHPARLAERIATCDLIGVQWEANAGG